ETRSATGAVGVEDDRFVSSEQCHRGGIPGKRLPECRATEACNRRISRDENERLDLALGKQTHWPDSHAASSSAGKGSKKASSTRPFSRPGCRRVATGASATIRA